MEQPIASSSTTPVTLALAPSKNGRTPGKAHKSPKTALRRSYISPSVKTPFEKRMEAEKQRQATITLEKEMKDEKQAEKDAKRNIIKERRERKEEKERLEALRAKRSAKSLQRLKKRQGRSKKIRG